MNTARSVSRRAAVAAATVVTALVLAACGAGSSAADAPTATPTTSAPRSAPAGRYNRADVAFAQRMIPHHRQAIAMADLARERASSPKVKAFARKVHKEQQPEIRTMTTWLKAWGEQVPRGIEGAGHNPSATPGMMSTHQMHRLKGALGSAFDTMFLTMMIKHHQGTVDMAKSEQRHGPYGPAKALAADIVTTQTAEIAQMRTMLSTGSPTATTR
ncbi:DUF305 domain-containing protein [Streptomyces hygroscopicus]|uniref:DUF305 domain-containing protein n=1 Tax=Streptomyces hygroscopicus TaxID=1912 RepID=UPI000767B1F7|nr:DUF305 domain-containing protein [Streptomyces hygroscopicus]